MCFCATNCLVRRYALSSVVSCFCWVITPSCINLYWPNVIENQCEDLPSSREKAAQCTRGMCGPTEMLLSILDRTLMACWVNHLYLPVCRSVFEFSSKQDDQWRAPLAHFSMLASENEREFIKQIDAEYVPFHNSSDCGYNSATSFNLRQEDQPGHQACRDYIDSVRVYTSATLRMLDLTQQTHVI